MNAVPQAVNDVWLTGIEAAEVLGTGTKHVCSMSDELRAACEYRIPGAEPHETDARGRGVLYLAHDIHRLARIMRCGLTLGMACRAMIGYDKGFFES